MSHEDVVDALPDLILGVLPGAVASGVEGHLERCEDCAARYHRYLARWLTDGRASQLDVSSQPEPVARWSWGPTLMMAAIFAGVLLLRPVPPEAVPLGPGDSEESPEGAPLLRVYAWDGAAGAPITDGQLPAALAVSAWTDGEALYGVDDRGVVRLLHQDPWYHWPDFRERGRVVAVRGQALPTDLAAADWAARLDRAGVLYRSMELARVAE